MPRGKYTRKNKRNENALTTRLMQISLKMDDHIYYDKVISASDASDYLQEIAALKLQCPPTNVRALQVIEKLNRCMRRIILEDTESGSNSCNSFQIGNDFAGSASPVYYLPDEDRTCDIGEQDDVTIGEVSIPADNASPKEQFSINKPIIKTSLRNSPTLLTRAETSHSIPTMDDIEIIDITNTSVTDEAENIAAVSQEQNGFIENVNIGMSNMAIQDEASELIQLLGDGICSQSILDNYDSENINKPNEKVIAVERNSPSKGDPKGRVIKSVNNYFTKNQAISKASELVDTQPIQVDLTGNCESVEAKPTDNNNKIKRKKKVTNAKENVPTKAKVKSTANDSAQNCPSLNTTMNTITTNDATNNTNLLLQSTSKTKKRLVNKKSHELYNNNIVNDLSWVENIRYVREICPEEYDPMLTFPDSFWDNFSLPNSWSDLDFEY